jgi:hypothetical protein
MKSRIDKTRYKKLNVFGDIVFLRNGERHRDRNLPAVIYKNGYCGWYVNGGYLRHSLPE